MEKEKDYNKEVAQCRRKRMRRRGRRGGKNRMKKRRNLSLSLPHQPHPSPLVSLRSSAFIVAGASSAK